ncbi:MAG TPA: alpha-amylase family glycosyl hydrolase, partial [bacterium]|nr:alpha-amylase family glycosyl hydrolase [bacterium]
DPNNPVRSSDGFNNSVISAGNEKKINYSVVSSNRLTKQNNSDEFEFFIEISPESNNSTAYFFCGNRLLSKVSGVKTGKISVNVPEEFLNLSQQNELNNEIYKIALVIVSGDFSYYCKSYVINAVKNNPVFNWRDGILYFAFTDRFYKHDQNFEYKVKEKENERDNFHGGNFKGLTKKINEGYFSKLGINTIWISPVFQNPADKIFAGYHGYWPLNSYNIAPNFGTIEDLKELVDTAKKNNIRIMVDYVAKHVYKENPVFKEHPEYFGNFILPDGRKNEKLFDEFPLTTWFGDYLPAFNFDNNDAVKFLTDNALWLVKETGADGFRLDAVKHIQHNFFTELRKRLKYEIEIPQKKIFYMVGESMTSREKIMEYANVSEMNGQFDFPLYWDIRSVFAASQSNFKNLNASLLDSLKTYGTETIMSTMLGNHDFSRFMAYADDEFKPDSVNEQEYGWKNDVKVNNPENYKKLKLAFAFLMTVPGIPLVYYGDEFGLSGAHDPDNRRDMRFGKELSEYEKECLDFTSKIISLRNQNSAFRYGDVIPLKVENELYCYGLSYFNKKAIVLLSRHFNGGVSIKLPEFFNVQKWNNVLNSTDFISENNSLKISIGEYSSLILVSEN